MPPVDPTPQAMRAFEEKLVSCERCPRLRQHCLEVARVKRRAFRDWDYWGRPVPSLGDPQARLLIIGLAPAAHGANRTGRMFTGDSSGDFLFRTLYETGFASQPGSTHRGDGLVLRDAYITAAAHCAPPGNKPTREEFALCRPYLEEEIELLSNVEVVVVLGRLALDTYLKILLDRGRIEKRSMYQFGHAVRHLLAFSNPRMILKCGRSRPGTK
ncbi:MAG: uracil-DNA glycosylase [Acidobacteria bacterium]|nr:uracil-DNA glycosylase [Acidobacteriota bacterium]